MNRYKNYKRKPKQANLSALMVITSSEAYDVKHHRFKTGLYGIVDKDLPFVAKIVTKRNGTQQRKFVNDVSNLPNVTKERIMAFFDDKSNSGREKCYLVERKLYDEVKGLTKLQGGKK